MRCSTARDPSIKISSSSEGGLSIIVVTTNAAFCLRLCMHVAVSPFYYLCSNKGSSYVNNIEFQSSPVLAFLSGYNLFKSTYNCFSYVFGF